MATAKIIPAKTTEEVVLRLTRVQYDHVLSALWAAKYKNNSARAADTHQTFAKLYEEISKTHRHGETSNASCGGVISFKPPEQLGKVKPAVVEQVMDGTPTVVLEMTREEAAHVYQKVSAGHSVETALDEAGL